MARSAKWNGNFGPNSGPTSSSCKTKKKRFVNKIPDQIDYELELNIYFDNAFTHMDTSPKESNQYSEYDPGMDVYLVEINF